MVGFSERLVKRAFFVSLIFLFGNSALAGEISFYELTNGAQSDEDSAGYGDDDDVDFNDPGAFCDVLIDFFATTPEEELNEDVLFEIEECLFHVDPENIEEPVGIEEPVIIEVESQEPRTEIEPEGKENAVGTQPQSVEQPVAAPAQIPAPSGQQPAPIAAKTLTQNNRRALKQYIRGLDYNPEILLAATSGAGKAIPLPKTRNDVSGGVVVCTRDKITQNDNFDKITIVQPTEGVIYPGALVYGDATLRDGQPRAIRELPRQPISLRVDLPGLGSEGSFDVERPSFGRYQGKLNDVLKIWNNGPSFKDGYVNAARSKYDIETAYSKKQIAASLGFKASWAGIGGSLDSMFKTDNEKHVVVAAFRQVFYSVTMDPPNSPEQAFLASVTEADARDVFDAKRPPAYVSSVNYGRILLFRMEHDKNITSADAKAAFEYGAGISVSTNTKYDQILRNSKINIFTLGGNAENAANTISAGSPKDLASIITGNNAVYSPSNPGVAISYTVKYLKDDRNAKFGSTVEYTLENCKKLDHFRVKLVHAGGFVGYFDLDWTQGNGQLHKEGPYYGKTAGWQEVITIPGDATNIKLLARNDTGLVWQPKRTIVEMELTPAMLKKPLCIQVFGTTLGSSWDKNCRF